VRRTHNYRLSHADIFWYFFVCLKNGMKLYNDQRNVQVFDWFIYLLPPYMFQAFFQPIFRDRCTTWAWLRLLGMMSAPGRGHRSRDLPVFSAVPQPLRHRVHHIIIKKDGKYCFSRNIEDLCEIRGDFKKWKVHCWIKFYWSEIHLRVCENYFVSHGEHSSLTLYILNQLMLYGDEYCMLLRYK
jgi:hypothetical protein